MMKVKSKVESWDWAGLLRSIGPYLVMIITIYLMMQWQLSAHATHLTSDSFLHFQRFYDTSMQLKTGNYSYFQTNYGFYHSGRIFNAMYGPLFAYLNGFLLLMCQSWYHYQVFIIFTVLLLAAIGMYLLALKVKVPRWLSLLLALIYIQFGIVVGITKMNWMAWGGALAPFACRQIVNMVQDKKRPIHWLSLALIVSLLAQIHLLSTLITVLTFIPFFIYAWVAAEDKKGLWLALFKAIGLTLLLTANAWGSLLVLYPSNYISSPNVYWLYAHTIKVAANLNDHGNLTGALLFLFAGQLIYVLFNFKKSVLNSLATLVSLGILLLASTWMPWYRLQKLFPRIGSVLQFPYRLALLAFPLLLMGAGISLTQILTHFSGQEIVKNTIAFALMLVLMQNIGGNISLNRSRTRRYQNPKQVLLMGSAYGVTKNRQYLRRVLRWSNDFTLFTLVSHVEPDYLPYKGRPSNVVFGKTVIDGRPHYHYQVKGAHLRLSWRGKKAAAKVLPIVMYHQSRLIFNGRKQNQIKKNMNCQPIVQARKGENQAELYFVTPPWFWLLLIIALLSWLAVILYLFYLFLRHYSLL